MTASIVPLALVALSLVVAGCSNQSSPPSQPTSTTAAPESGIGEDPAAVPGPVSIAVKTSGNYPVNPAFDPSELSVPAGARVNLTFTNEDACGPAGPIGSPIVHDWTLEDTPDAETKQLGPCESQMITFTAPAAGAYTYYCAVGDHRQRGMEGTLTVTSK